MDRLEKLVKQYKKKQNKKVLEEIFSILKPQLKEKTDFVYSRLQGYKLDLGDIRQELCLKVLQIIKSYDSKKEDFSNYFFSSIWYWQPEMRMEDVIQYESIYKINEEDEKTETTTEERFKKETPEEFTSNITIEDILNECKTENEKKICEMYLENPMITEEELGKKLKMTHQNISLILIELRKRLKKYLQE